MSNPQIDFQSIMESPAPRPRSAPPKPQPPSRIVSLDQLRGYAIFGMIFVNFLHFDWLFNANGWTNPVDHSRNHFSYADTIAPLFIFVVGMGFRLSLGRRIERVGQGAAYLSVAKRYAVLALVAVAFYGPAYWIDWWDALTHIALAGLLCIPLVDKHAGVRIGAAALFLIAYELIVFQTGYGPWLEEESMNGGPFGTLGYCAMLLFGTLAYDLLATRDDRTVLLWGSVAAAAFLVASVVVYKLVNYGGLAEFENYGALYPFAKRWSLAPFSLMSLGFCFVAFIFFYYVCEVAGFEFPGLTVLGMNPLVIYLVQYALLEMNGNYFVEWVGERSGRGLGYGLALIVGYLVFYGFNYAVARRLRDDNVIIKL